MSYYLINLLVAGFAGIVFWRLSDYDSKLAGESEKGGLWRRIIRCGVGLMLVEIGFLGLWRYWRYGDRPAGWLYIIICVSLTFIWIGCLTEFLAHIFSRLVDPQDDREHNPRKEQELLDRIGDLIRSGRKKEAIELCRALKESDEVNRSTLELTLEYLGVPQDRGQKSGPLLEAHRLRVEGKYDEAESLLKSLWRGNPMNTEAAFMLMRLYAEDMKLQDKANEVLRSLEKQPHVSPAYIEFARRSIGEWQKPQPQKPPAEPAPETLDELLAQRYFGTAADILEQQVNEDPNNFDAWLRLIEVHGRYCANFQLAEKTLRRMERNPAFSPSQIEQAQNQLTEWKRNGNVMDKSS